MLVLTWNTKWSRSKTGRGTWFRSRLMEVDADVVCLTEAFASLLPAGHIIESDADYGYRIMPGRRKVILWSPKPWRDIDVVGSKALPSGRFVSGVTETPAGDVRFVGVCVPWKDAHVRTGRKDRATWEDHLAYLAALPAILKRRTVTVPTVILGDFNQRIPARGQRKDAADALQRTLDGWTVCTAGIPDEDDKQLIDHLATDGSLISDSIQVLSRYDKNGRPMSDHVGVKVGLRRRE